MLSGVLGKHIVSALSQYFYVTEDQLNLSVISGKGTIDDLVLKPTALDEYDLPFTVDSGVCKRVSFAIPWTNLGSKQCDVTIDEVLLLAQDLTEQPSEEEIQRKLQRAKERMIENFEKQRKSMLNDDDENKGFGSRLFEKIVHNLMLDVRQIHVRFETSTREANAGIIVNDLKFTTLDEHGNEKFVDPKHEWRLNKRLSFKGLRAYSEDPKSKRFFLDLDKGSRLDEMATSMDAPERNLILGPIDGLATAKVVFKRFILERQDRTAFATIDVDISEFVAKLTREQYVAVLQIVGLLSDAAGKAPKAEDVGPTDPKLVKEYEALFSKHLFHDIPADSKEAARWEELQLAVSGPDTIDARKRVYASLKGELSERREKLKQIEADEQKNRGWFSFGGNSKSKENAKLYKDLEKEFGVEGEEEVVDLRSLPPSYCWQDLRVNVGKIGAHIIDETCWKQNLVAGISDTKFQLRKLNKDGSIAVKASARDVLVQNPTVSVSWIPYICCRSPDDKEKHENLLTVRFESNPVEQLIEGCTVDTLIDVTLRPILALGDPGFINKLGKFFAVPKSVKLDTLAAATADMANAVKNAASDQLQNALDGATTQVINFNAAAPTLLLPPSLATCLDMDPVMSLSFGQFKFQSEPLKDDEKKRRIALAKDAAKIEADPTLLYYKNTASIVNVSAAVGRAGQALRECGRCPHYLLQPMRAQFDVYNRITPGTDDYAPIMVKGHVEELRASMSVHDAYVVRRMLDAWDADAAAQSVADSESAASRSIAPDGDGSNSDDGDSGTAAVAANASASDDSLRNGGKPLVSVAITVDNVAATLMDDDRVDLDRLAAEAEKLPATRRSHVVAVGQGRHPRFSIDCNTTTFDMISRDTGSKLIVIKTGEGLCVRDVIQDTPILRHAPIDVEVTTPSADAPAHLGYSETHVTLPRPAEVVVGTPLMEFAEVIIDIKNMLLSPSDEAEAERYAAAAAKKAALAAMASPPRLREVKTTVLRINVAGASAILMNRDPSVDNGITDYEYAAASVAGVTVDVDMYTESMQVAVKVVTVAAKLKTDTHYPDVIGPMDAEADADAAHPMLTVDFNALPQPSSVELGSDGKTITNLDSVEFAKEVAVKLRPARVVFDTFTLLSLITYGTTGFLSRLAAVGSRKRYDGNAIPSAPSGPQQLTKLDITVERPQALVPQDVRRGDLDAFAAELESVRITNDIRNRDAHGSICTTIELTGLTARYTGAETLALSGGAPLKLIMDQPIVSGAAAGVTTIDCDTLGDFRVSEPGLIALFSMLSNNLLRMPAPPEADGAATTTTKDSADADAPKATTSPDAQTNISLKHFSVVAIDEAKEVVFTTTLSDLSIALEGPKKDIRWTSLQVNDRARDVLFDCSTGTVGLDAPRKNHQAIDIAFHLRRFAVSPDWVDVYDFVLSEASMAALGPLMGADKPAAVEDAKQQAKLTAADPSTMSLKVSVPSVSIPLLHHQRGDARKRAELFMLETKDITVELDRTAEGMALDIGIAAIRMKDTVRNVLVVSEGLHSNSADQRELAVRYTKNDASNDQTVKVVVDRLLASASKPTIDTLIGVLTRPDGSVMALTKLSTMKEARARDAAPSSTAAAAKNDGAAAAKKQAQAATPSSSAPAGTMKIALEWHQPTICVPASPELAAALHDAASKPSSFHASRTSAISDGIIIDLGSMSADLLIDNAKRYTAANARLEGAAITGLLSETQISVKFQEFGAAADVEVAKRSVEVKIGETAFSASPSALETLNAVLNGNLLLPPEESDVIVAPTSTTSTDVSASTKDDAAAAKGPELTVCFICKQMRVRCLTDAGYLFATYRVVDVDADLRPGGDVALTVARLEGQAENGSDGVKKGAPSRDNTTDLHRLQFLSCGDSTTNALKLNVDAAAGTTDVQLAGLGFTLIPEVVGRTADLGLVFVAAESRAEAKREAVKPASPKQAQAPDATPTIKPSTLSVALSRAKFTFVAEDGTPIAALLLDGMNLSSAKDEYGVSKLNTRVTTITMQDLVSKGTKFPNLVENGRGGGDSSASGSSSTSFVEVELTDIPVSRQRIEQIDGVPASACPRFTKDCKVCVAALNMYFVPEVLVEIQAAIGRAGAVMENLERTKDRAIKETERAKDSTPTELLKFALTMQRPTVYLVRDVTIDEAVGLSPGSLTVANALVIEGMSAYQLYHASLDEMRVEALGSAILHQTKPCSADIRIDATPLEARELSRSVSRERLNNKADDEAWAIFADVGLPPIDASVDAKQFEFLLGFASAVANTDVRQSASQKKAAAAAAAAAAKGTADELQDAHIDPAATVAKSPREAARKAEADVAAGARRFVKLNWHGAKISIADVVCADVDMLNAEVRLVGPSTHANVAADGLCLTYANVQQLLRLSRLQATLARVPLTAKEDIIETRIEADLGAVEAALMPCAVKGAVEHLVQPVQRHFLRLPEPGPMLRLEEHHTVKAEGDLKPTMTNPILATSCKSHATFVLDLQKHTLDLTSAGKEAPLIVVRDHVTLTVKNGTVVLPGQYSARSFVSFGFNTCIDFDMASVNFERITFAELRAKTAAVVAPPAPGATKLAHGAAAGTTARPAQVLSVTAKLDVRVSLQDDDGEDPVGIKFGSMLALSQKSSAEGVATQRNVTVDLRDVTDVLSDLLEPTSMQLRLTGTEHVCIEVDAQPVVATIRYARARYVASTAKKLLAVLPKAPGSEYSAMAELEDIIGRPLTHRGTRLHQCSVCGAPKTASLGAGTRASSTAVATTSSSRSGKPAPAAVGTSADDADVWVCVPCATGGMSLAGTTVRLDLPSVDITVIGKQGEMVQLCVQQGSITTEQDAVTASVKASVWTSNPYCGQWEALVEDAAVNAFCVLSLKKYEVEAPRLAVNVTAPMVQLLQQFQADMAEVADADDAAWTRTTSAEVANWTEHSVRAGGTIVRPQEIKVITNATPLMTIEVSETGQFHDKTDKAGVDGYQRHVIALDRTAVLAATPHVADVSVTGDASCHVDLVPVHSRDGIVKVVSLVDQRLHLLGIGGIDPQGSIFLRRDVSVDNALIIEPFAEDDDYQMALPTDTANPTIRRLLNGGTFSCTAESKTRKGQVALHFRINARNVGMSLGVPRFEVVIRGGFTFRNLLPHRVEVQWATRDNRLIAKSSVSSNQQEEITVAASASSGAVHARLIVGEGGSVFESELLNFQSGEKRLPLRGGTAGRERELAVTVSVSEGTMSVSAPFFIVNHTAIPLELSLVDDGRAERRNFAKLPPSDSNGVVCTPPVLDASAVPELTVMVGFNRMKSLKPVPLHVTGRVCNIEVVDSDTGNTLHFTYQTSFTDETYTSRTVVITPRWVVVNRTKQPLYFSQDLRTTSTNGLQLKPSKALQYYSMDKPPQDHGYQINISRTGKDGTGKGFSVDEMCAGRVVVGGSSDTDPLQVLQLTVKPDGPITYVVADDVAVDPFLFINRTAEKVEIIDGETTDKPQAFAAFEIARLIVCEKRTSAKAVKLRVAGVDLSVNLDATENHDNALGLQYELKAGPRGQTILILLPGNATPAAIARSKTRRFTNIVYEDQTLKVRVGLASLCLAHNAQEIANVVVKEVTFHQERRKLVETMKASIEGFQIDNNTQERPPHSVVVFSLRKDQKVPALAFSCERQITGARGFIHFRQIAVDVQPLIVKVGDLFLVRLLTFVNDGTDTAAATSHRTAGGSSCRPPLVWPYKNEEALVDAAPVEEGAMASTLAIDKIVINPVYLRVWFTRQRDHDVLAEHLGPAVSKLAITLEDVVLQAEGYVADKVRGSVSLVAAQMQAFYEYQIKTQLFGLVFQYMSAIPLVGAPIKYAATIGTGVAKFFTEPIEGLTESPSAFATGLARGSATLVGSVVGGGFGAVSDVTKAGSHLANVASGEKADSGHNSKTPGLFRGIAKGITGVFTKPVKGAAEGGAAGFAKGVAHGVVGVVAAPVGGLLSDVSRVSNFASGVLQSKHIPDIDRVRLPRSFGHTGALVPVGSVVDVFEYHRLHGNTWSSALLPTDGPRTRSSSGDKEATRSELEKRYKVPKDKVQWNVDRFRTNFDGWVYSDEYWGQYAPAMNKDTHIRRRRFVLVVGAVTPSNPGGLSLDAAPSTRTSAGARSMLLTPNSPATPSSEATSGTNSSFSRSAAPPSAAAVKVKVYEVYENQRHFPVAGWGSKLLPTDRDNWTNMSGTVRVPAKDDTQLPSHWTWVSPWTVSTANGDEEGWEYAIDFPASYHPENRMDRSVRRRAWRRVAMHDEK